MYREFNLKLGRTSAGLKYSEIEPGSAIYNLIGKLYVCKFSISLTFYLDEMKEDFPYWEHLHGYWRTLPNFNPLTVTSEPGQDLEADAVNLFGGGHSLPAGDDFSNPDLEVDQLVPTSPPADAFAAAEQDEMDNDPNADGDVEVIAEDNKVFLQIIWSSMR